jgi:hypothetical protein
MIYAGYIYHPIIHRAGNNIYEKFQTEFVPVEERTSVTATQTKFTPPPVTPPPENRDSKDTGEDSQSEKTEDIVTDNTSENINSPDDEVDKSSTNNFEVSRRIPPYIQDNKYSAKPPKPVIPKPNPKPKTLPPRFDLLTSIKKGLDVSNPSKYFISSRDRELGEKVLKLEAEFNQQYENRGLTFQQIKQLKADYDKSFSELARQYGLSSQQLIKFQGLIRNNL